MSVLTHHWELKLLALGVSMVLWAFVMTSEKSDVIMAAPLELDNIPAGPEVKGERPDSGDGQLRGLRGTLSRLGSDRGKGRLNLSGSKAGEVTMRGLPGETTVPPATTGVRGNSS